MTYPQLDDPPLTGSVCAAWAQMHELPADVQQYFNGSPEVWCSILAFASDILWAASGRQWRNVEASETVTLDPLDDACATQLGYAYQHGYWSPDRAVAGRPSRVRLPRPDVTAITSAEIDGVPFTFYRRSGNYAIRTDGGGWPMVETTRITYSFGRLVPHTGKLAVLHLAAELGKMFAGQKCALPARVTSVVRQGISMDMLESLEVLREGLTGLHAVDQFILATNPNRSRQAGSCWSPDIVVARQV
jgi:hypothetical protein